MGQCWGLCNKSVTAIIMGLDRQYHKDYYKILMFRIYGDNAEKQIQKDSKIFIYLGLGMIIYSFPMFIALMFLF